jgi:hypothetical protein
VSPEHRADHRFPDHYIPVIQLLCS